VKQSANRRRGAVLLEVVLALVLFVAAAAVFTSAINASVDSVERQRLNTHAVDLAITVLSELQMGIRSTETNGPEAFPEPFENWSWELQSESVESDTGEATSLTKVEVVIRHKERPVVYRLSQIVRLRGAGSGKEEPSAAEPF
jgi:type II secretory pathway pseudopilin PulG